MQERRNAFMNPMLPYGLLSAVMQESPGNRKEIQNYRNGRGRILLSNREAICSPQKLEVCFYDMERAEYGTVVITEFEICREKEEDFFTQFLVWTEQEEYRRQVQKLVRQYSKYIRLKLEDDGELESELTGYPSEFDGEHCSSLEEQRQYWFAEKAGRAEINMEIPEHTECAIELDCPERYTAYLQKSLPEFYHDYLRKNHLQGSGLEARIPDRIYIGNQFCHLLFPEEELLFAMLEKAKKSLRQLRFLLLMSEKLLEDTFALLRKIDHWCSKNELEMECVVNDWGMQILSEKKRNICSPASERFLTKEKKIPVSITKKASETCTARTVSMQIFTRNF